VLYAYWMLFSTASFVVSAWYLYAGAFVGTGFALSSWHAMSTASMSRGPIVFVHMDMVLPLTGRAP
jgi:hypothetical protein